MLKATLHLAVWVIVLFSVVGSRRSAAQSQPRTGNREPRTARAGAASPTHPSLLARRTRRIADSVLALMTLDEKIGQLTQVPNDWQQTGPTARAGSAADIRAGRIGAYVGLYGAVSTREAQRVAVEESRLRIPLLFGFDVIHGMRTIFPIPLAMAGTFDSTAAVRMARISAREATASGVQWTFAPMVDVARDARWGRIIEGAGEDPRLGSVMAAAQVVGFQGADLRSPNSVLATVKHFAAYGGAEAGRDYNVVHVGERELWETYMPPYAAGVRAGAGSVMASFNEIDGIPAHGSDWLLGRVLRDTWGFRGMVVSDWSGIWEMISHGVGDSLTVARRALAAGVDMEMSSLLYRNRLTGEVRARRLPVRAIDAAVHRVLVAKAALGLFDDPYRGVSEERERTGVLTADDRRAAREIAQQAIVLLTNNAVNGTPALPLSRSLRSVAVIGPLALDSVTPLGSWSGAGRPEDVVPVFAGLVRASPQTVFTHAAGVPADTLRVVESNDPRYASGIAAAVQAATAADAVILVLGEHRDLSGEGASRSHIELPGAQEWLARAVIRAVRAATPNKPVIAVLVNGRPLAVPFLADSASALVESWQLGVEHGNALADVLFGDVAPSGRLAVTMPRSTGQVPIYYNRKQTGRPADPDFARGQKYTSRYVDVAWTPQFVFGHGLSYTTFGYANLRVSRPSIRGGESVTVSVDVSNTGSRAGTEVAQLYVRDDAASVTRPIRELRGFSRVTLQPGETRTVTFALSPDDLALYDRDLRRVVEPGTFTVWAGGSSAATLETRLTVMGPVVVVRGAVPRMR